jgi:hypothetical protein
VRSSTTSLPSKCAQASQMADAGAV